MAGERVEGGIITGSPPTSEEALAMAEGEWRDIKEKYGLHIDFWGGWRLLQRAGRGLTSLMPRGRERVSDFLFDGFRSLLHKPRKRLL